MGFQDIGHGTRGCLECGKQINGALKKNCSADEDLCRVCHKEYMVFKHVRLYMPGIWAELSKDPACDWNKTLRILLPPEEYEELYALAVAPRRTIGEDMIKAEIAIDPRFYRILERKMPCSRQRVDQLSDRAYEKLRESGRLFKVYRELYGLLDRGGLRA